MEQQNLSVKEWHKIQAKENFNYTWDLIDKRERTKDDEMEMKQINS